MAKEKKPSYSDYIVMHFVTVALRIRAAVSFRLSKMNDDPTPCNLVRRHIGGCRHVNFCHSQ